VKLNNEKYCCYKKKFEEYIAIKIKVGRSFHHAHMVETKPYWKLFSVQTYLSYKVYNQLRHIEKVYKITQHEQRQIIQQHHQKEEQLFIASCYTTRKGREVWL